MKSQLIAIVAAVLVVGCGESPPPEPPTAKAPDRTGSPPIREAILEISIHIAAHDGDIEAIKQHIADGADVDAKLDRGYTALHYAAHEGHKEIAQLLIAAGADVNAKDDDGRTPLHYAANHGDKVIVEPLIANGADVNPKDEDGETPLDWAIDRKRTETAELLHKHGGKTGEELKAEGK